MRRHNSIRGAAEPAAIGFLLSAAIAAMLLGCPSADKYHKAATLSKDFAAAVLAAQQAEIALHNQGKIDNAEHQDLQEYFIQTAVVGKQLDDAINKLHSGEKAQAALDDALTKIQALSDQGVLHIKNEEAQASLRIAVLSAKVILDQISALAE